jgi:predicted nucleic acid-binding protein
LRRSERVQEKVIFDTSVYIGVFNHGLFQNEINGFNKIMYLVHPVLHELWIGAKGKKEVNHLIRFGAGFIKLGRLVVPAASTQVLIGKVCQKLRLSGKLDPSFPRIYNDISIALLARQIGATVVTRNISDFEKIYEVMDFRFRDVIV